MITNTEFLQAIFGVDTPFVHVTDFTHDPNNLPKDQHLIAWKGDYFSRYRFSPGSNQYFTISTFYCDEQQQARRRKVLYRQTHCIVLDDVSEKLNETAARRLPEPSWILETSPGSFQWGYILDTPCTVPARVDNLNDGLIASDLAPSGKDPGQRGVTRYVRLPEGFNNKASKLVNGQPFDCRMVSWQPFNRVTMEQLAAPFAVDLDTPRRESRVDGAAAVSDHPLINTTAITIKEVRSDGRFEITCPWVHDHTGNDDSGAAVFTNSDGSIGFRCHHGSCESRTGGDLLKYIEIESPGFSATLKNWQVMRDFDVTPLNQPELSFLDPPTTEDVIQTLYDNVRRSIPGTAESRVAAEVALKHVDDIPKMEQKHWHDELCDMMRWSKSDFKEILKDLRKKWYVDKTSAVDFYQNTVFVKDLNQFYEPHSRIFFTPEAFLNAYADQDADARNVALRDGMVTKVDKLDYAPGEPSIFIERGVKYGNMWSDKEQPKGAPGDITRWHDHFDVMGWAEHRKHITQWMAYTLRYPEVKINHMILLGSGEGCGKDFLLHPLMEGMGENAVGIEGDELLDGFNDYVLSAKYLHINETDLGDHKEARRISNKLKPIAAAPPKRVRVNQKQINKIQVRNIINGAMTTNSQLPIKLNGPSRRFYAVWSDLDTLDEHGQPRQEWKDYWKDRWTWMEDGGWQHVLHHLLHEVDLSDFNPSEAPPVTDFLKDIMDSSKSPQQQTIEAFIKARSGLFQCDLLTPQDISDTVRSDGLFRTSQSAAQQSNMIYCDVKYFSPEGVGKAMSTLHGVVRMRGRSENSTFRIYAVRNVVKYQALTALELHREYKRQHDAALGDGAHLKVVN